MTAPVSTSTSARPSELESAVSNDRSRTRVEVLIDEFCDRGMDTDTAEELAHHVILHHPMARILGIGTLSRDIAARGMEPDASREVATVLLGIELFDRGADYQTVVKHLKRQPISGSDALAGALEASRIHRLAKPDPARPAASATYLAAGFAAIGVALIMVGMLINLAR